MENPRERLFPYHLNADEIEKEFRIWKCIEQQLKQDRYTKRKREISLEENRKDLWDSLKEQRIKKKSNPGKGKKKAKHNPNWEGKRDKSLKNSLIQSLETKNRQRNQDHIWEEKRNHSKKNNPKKHRSSNNNELDWEKKRINENNETLKRKLIQRKKEQIFFKSLNDKNEKVESLNLNWEEQRRIQNYRALDNRIELNKKLWNLEKEREKLHNHILQRRMDVLKKERKRLDKWDNNINFDKERDKLHNDALQRRMEEIKEESKYMEKWESKRDKTVSS